MDYYFWKSLGVGVTYEYIKSSMERDSTEFTGMVSNRSSSLESIWRSASERLRAAEGPAYRNRCKITFSA